MTTAERTALPAGVFCSEAKSPPTPHFDRPTRLPELLELPSMVRTNSMRPVVVSTTRMSMAT
jgi:hypothetical protein